MRRAWIESYKGEDGNPEIRVALHAESVDRKDPNMVYSLGLSVALHAESVDRKYDRQSSTLGHIGVALHAESVDRKACFIYRKTTGISRSPCGERG